MPLEEIAFAAGYASVRRFHQAMRAVYQRNPGELRRETGMAAEGTLSLRLTYRPPYNWNALLAFLGPRATTGVEEITSESYRRDGLDVRHAPQTHCIAVRLREAETRSLRPLVSRLRRMWDLDADIVSITGDLRRSALLRPLVDRHPGIRLPGCWDPFELTVRAILGQQVTVKGATTLMNRAIAMFGAPRAAALADAPVERIGIPGKRAESIRAIARAVTSGEIALDGSMPPEAVIERIRSLPGLGPWTANYVAMRALGAPDAFPASDLGLLKAAGFTSARKLGAAAEAWRPWRSYAAFTLWRSLE
jgi:AraC family transcriptional regulator of adaptative response / DNA-3-methyladenine glycosylase II